MLDRDQFLLLFLSAEADLRAFIGSLVPDRHARDDILQECALALWHQFDEYDRQRSFGAWARAFAANKVMQRRQADRRFPVAFSPETIGAVLDAYDRTEDSAVPRTEALQQCLEELPERSRQLLRLRYERNLSGAEVARESGRTLDAVYQALSRIRTSLENCIRRRLATVS